MKQESLFSIAPQELIERCRAIFNGLGSYPLETQISIINQIKLMLHEISPFSKEPVDCVLWLPSDSIQANDYNPNTVAPPEMKLLELSIDADGYTQPIVTWDCGSHKEVIDGFHRNRIGKESNRIKARIYGHLPVVVINDDRVERGDRIAATIRHNRARGKHRVEGMSDIVVELKRRNWSDEKISKNLGMDSDEILRLCQITGLAELFADQEFSQSWDVEGEVTEHDYQELSDDPGSYEGEMVRTANTNDPDRIFHTYEKWECYKAGFYSTTKEGMTRDECESAYRAFLGDPDRFRLALNHVIKEWKHSCEHYLTNRAMNRIAWLGQAAACYALGIPAVFRNGFNLLTEVEQKTANEIALEALNQWLEANGRPSVTMDEAYSYERQMDIY